MHNPQFEPSYSSENHDDIQDNVLKEAEGENYQGAVVLVVVRGDRIVACRARPPL